MPRVHVKTKNRAGRTRTCGNCGATIEPGEKYRTWAFRYGGARYRCFRAECAPKRSDLTQSKLGEVFSAIEAAESDLTTAEAVDAIEEAVWSVGEVARAVADEYREAAEPFGGEGENAERADEVEEVADECEGFALDEDQPLAEARDEAEQFLSELPI